MKNNQRLSHRRLAEELAERELVETDALNEILEAAARGGPSLPFALIEGSLLSDWEISRVVCELYNLPFVTVEIASPIPEAMEGLDPFFLLEHGLVPLARHGGLLTVCMPAMVSAEVLQRLAADSGLTVRPVVGTVSTNRHWLSENLVSATALNDPAETGWSAIFDEADAAVLEDLERQQEADLESDEEEAVRFAGARVAQGDEEAD